MRRISLFLTACSSWRTGRWFLAASFLALLVALLAPDMILRFIMSPNADFSRNGWWMHFHTPSRDVGVKGYQVFLPAAPLVALNPDFTRARGYMLWSIPVDSEYRIQFLAEDHGTLSVDGKVIAELGPDAPEGKRVETWVSLKKGVHLFQTRIENDSGRGGFTVEVVTPPKMSAGHLLGSDVAVPKVYFLDFWWWLMSFSHVGRGAAWAITGFFSLCLLLPITLANRRVSVPAALAIVLAPALIIPYQVEREPYIGKMIHQQLQQKNPAFVFIGNSMLWSRIDDAELEKLLGGEKVFSIINFGGLSAVHYLSFKYLFLPSGIRPKRVFIFFRSNQFIFPRARTTDDPFVEKIIQRITPAPDPVYEQIVYGRSRSVTDIVYDSLIRLFPVGAAQDATRRKLGDGVLSIVSPWTGGDNKLLARVNQRFSLTGGSLRAGVGTETLRKEAEKNSFDFYGRVEDSFLPHILRLANERSIPLAFIRVQERPTEQGARPDPPEMKQYMRDLRQYLEDHGAALYDFTGDPELPLSAYHDGDHIKDQKKYTELFHRRVRHLLQ